MRYIGSKINLLEKIRSLVDSFAPESSVFCDLFAGTGVVGREFKRTHKLISNDLLYFCFVLNSAYNGLSVAPTFSRLKRELNSDPIDFLNGLTLDPTVISDRDFMTLAYSRAGAAQRMYLSVENALKIDKIRQHLDLWHKEQLIDEGEFHYLLASLIEEVPSVSNTTGTYGAFLKNWDQRALKPIRISHLPIGDGAHVNEIHNSDANELIRQISGDVLYLDTPYNGRQYSSNYHLLETLALYDSPELKGITGTRVDNSGNSAYCRRSTVFDSYDDLLAQADFATIVVSYSSEGLLDEAELVSLMAGNGRQETMDFRKIPYRRYKRTAGDNRVVTEYLIAINK